jgi:hypothetical protein
VRWLHARVRDRVVAGAPVARVARQGAGAAAPLRVQAGARAWDADAVIWAAPLFLAAHVVEGSARVPWTYAPWLVANLTLDGARRGASAEAFDGGAPESWDNVIADSPALGYVVATHQQLRATRDARTCGPGYHAMPTATRARRARGCCAMDWRACADLALDDLARAHPDLRACVTRVDVRRYGHAMPRPDARASSARTARGGSRRRDARVLWAHSDVSGLALFEEAQDRGVRAADARSPCSRAGA